MDELGGVVVLGLVMTGVVAALAAVLRWSQNRAEHQASRVTSIKRTASPNRATREPDPHSSGAGFDAGAPDPVDFAGAQPYTGQRKSDPPVRH